MKYLGVALASVAVVYGVVKGLESFIIWCESTDDIDSPKDYVDNDLGWKEFYWDPQTFRNKRD